EYSQWVERFMNYLEEQTDGEAMINSIKNGDQPLPRVTQVSIAGTSSTEQPSLKDKFMCNKTAKDLWDALARHMLGSEYGDVNDVMGSKKKTIVITSDPLALIAEKTKVSKKKINALLAKSFNRRKFYSKPTNNNLRTSSTSQSGNKKQEFVKSDDKQVVKKADEKKRDVSKVKCYNCKKEGHFAKDCKKVKVKDYEYYKTKMLLAKKDKDEQVLLAEYQAWMESSSDSDQEINANMVFMAQIEKVLFDSEASSSSVDEKIFETVHMIMPSKDNLYNVRKGIGFENPSEKAKDLRPTLYDEKVIGLGHTPMFLTHSDEALEIKKFKTSRENKIEFAYDYRNLNASYVNEKINFEDDYFQEIINLDFEKIDSSFQQTSSLKPYVPNVILEKIIIDLEDEVVNLLKKDKVNLETIESLKSKGFESSETFNSKLENQRENNCLVVEKECDKEENPKLIAPGMFKLNVSQCVSPISMSKSSCESNNVEIKLKRKRRKRKSSKQNVKQVDNDVLRANSDFIHFTDLDTFSSVRRPKNNDGETSSASVCNDAMNVSRMNDLLDDNNFFIFNDESVKISSVSKMPFRKKPCDSMNVRSKSNMIKSLPRTVCCSKHMTGNHALLMNFVEKFLGTVRFGNNGFAVIAGYGDVVIGSMTIKKVYYVEGL
nr:integrase, catalytic region, zinc finger, CCHC-type, peptidase aspartic, catalytic [Tanacetum cinerariifolium]